MLPILRQLQPCVEEKSTCAQNYFVGRLWDKKIQQVLSTCIMYVHSFLVKLVITHKIRAQNVQLDRRLAGGQAYAIVDYRDIKGTNH